MGETTYRANCHCGQFVYEVTLPEPVTKALVCNCSICYKKGHVLVFPPPGREIRVVRGSIDDLASYTFGAQQYHHKFCGDCGSALLVVPSDPARGMGLNGPLAIWSLELQSFDGRALPPPYEEPAFTGAEPTGAPLTRGTPTLYHGSCHCGAVRLALRSQPLDATLDMAQNHDDRTVECDCSICVRNAYRWFYAKADQVAVQEVDPGRGSSGSSSSLAYYAFNRHISRKAFCRVCGVALFSCGNDLAPDALAALPPRARDPAAVARRAAMHARCNVNLRAFHGLDLAAIPAKYLHGYVDIEPAYTNP